MSKELKFKNHGVDYTYDGVDWTGVELETIQSLAWAYAKTAPLDAFCEGKSGHLGTIKMNEALNVKIDRVTVTAKLAAYNEKSAFVTAKIKAENITDVPYILALMAWVNDPAGTQENIPLN